MKNETLSIQQIADELTPIMGRRLHIATPRRWIKTGKLQAVLIGREYRVSREALDEFLQLPKDKGGRPPKRKKVLRTSQRERP